MKKVSELETWELHPRNFNKAIKQQVNKRLWKYAPAVMTLERELGIHPLKQLIGVKEMKFDLGSKREAKVITGVKRRSTIIPSLQ